MKQLFLALTILVCNTQVYSYDQLPKTVYHAPSCECKDCPNKDCPAKSGGKCDCKYSKIPKGSIGITIPTFIEIKVPGRLKEIEAITDGELVEWVCSNSDDVDLITKNDRGNKVIFNTLVEDTYILYAFTATLDVNNKPIPLKSNACIVKVGKGKPSPDNPPDNPPDDNLDKWQKTIKDEYTKLGKPKDDMKSLSAYYAECIKVINDMSINNTMILDMALKAKSKELGITSKLVSIRTLASEYLRANLDVNAMMLTDTERKKWNDLFHYLQGSIDKVIK